jgi:flagellar hook-associated protein FlgK
VSTFGSLNTATTALWSQRRALDVTSQNIANVNTEGYSRQRAELRSVGGSTVPAFFSTSTGIGGGVRADDVIRIRDAFLEGRAHTERANQARLTAVTDALSLVERATREPGDTGVQKLLSEVWAGFEDVANAPEDGAARSQVLRRLGTLADGIRSTHATLGAQWQETRENVGVLVAEVNATAAEVAQLNDAIQLAVRDGFPANDLADRRDLLVVKLAGQIGATARPGADGAVDVSVGGISIVSAATATPLSMVGSLDPDDLDPDSAPAADAPRIVTASGGHVVRVGGTAGGQLTALTDVLPRYRDELDDLAAQLADTLNAVHQAGTDLTGAAGGPLLGSTSGPVGAATLVLLVTDPDRLAAASTAPGTVTFDNGNALALAALRQQPGGPDATYRRTIVELGVESTVAGRDLDIQSVITAQVDAARDSVAGVDLDEEMTNMLSFQHAYAAAARLVTAIDETLDILITRTGLVGL